MISDFALTKNNRSKTQPNQPQQNPGLLSQPYVNPVIKHTLQSLPLIYGGNMNRKRKYNLFMKSKMELNNIISRVHDRNYLPNQRLYKRINDERPKGYSAFQMSDSNGHASDEREQNTKTVSKKNKKIVTEPDSGQGGYERSAGHSRAISNQQRVHHALITPKKNKLVRLQSLDELAKPKDKCKNQYCSCKSIYEEYQNEINKKIKQKMQVLSASRKEHNHKFNLPRLSFQIGHKALTKLDDQQSKHKVSFGTKINSLNQNSQSIDNCCHLCIKDKKQPQVSQKGILGLIKKKQLEQKRNKLACYSITQQIGITLNNMGTQMSDNLVSDAEAPNQEYGTQADLTNHPKKLKTIDQQINTDFDEQSTSFRHLENNHKLKDSALKQNKKEPMEHLSHLKEKYKYQKRPAYKSKYDQDHEDDQKDHQNDQDSDASPQKCNNPNNKQQKQKLGKIKSKYEKVDPLNTSNDSIISENSMMNHLANALATNGKDKSTIFKLLKKKEKEETERDGITGQKQEKINQNEKERNKKSKPKKQYKKMNLINEETGLFSIPEQQQYVDYLKGYQPIQKEFKVKDLVKSQNFKILKYKDTLYFGQATADNTKNGKALLISPKQIFEGFYENGVKMSGCQRNIDGVYMGQFLNGMRHGEGKWVWNNGQVYEGEWKLGTKNGYGVWKSPKGDSYEGEWVLNRQQGKGIHRHKNSVYEGEFAQALKQGYGRQKYINGDEYIGNYYKGRPHGKGKYIWKNSHIYQGQFKDGLRSGYGKWTYSNKAFYEGQFANDFKHGKGKQIFANGDQYEGQYYEGQKINGNYIEAATGKVKEIKIEKKRPPKNEQKIKQKQASPSKSRIKNRQKQEPIQKTETKEPSKEVKEIKPNPVQNNEEMKESKVQIQAQKNEEENKN